MTPRLLAIGDLHGQIEALEAVLEAAEATDDDRLIFLGDYVDSGPHSAQVLERVMSLVHSGRAVAILGNHDDIMRQALSFRSGPQMDMWMAMGGGPTLDSYRRFGARTRAPTPVPTDHEIGHTEHHVPTSHIRFLAELPIVYETRRFIFVHGGLEPHLPADQQSAEIAIWKKTHDAKAHRSGKTIVCGHTRQQSGNPQDLGHTVCIDTNAKAGGWVTCLELFDEPNHRRAERPWRYWQASPHGDTRKRSLG